MKNAAYLAASRLKTDQNTCNDNKKNNRWTKEEDCLLKTLVAEREFKSWQKISEYFQTKSINQCITRWKRTIKPGLVRGPWTAVEDNQLRDFVDKHGEHNFHEYNKHILGRDTKQCKERWFNVLSPRIIKGSWTIEEDYLIFLLYSSYGTQWVKYTEHFQGNRAENNIKNRFYSTLRKFSIKKTSCSGNKLKEIANYVFTKLKIQIKCKYELNDFNVGDFEYALMHLSNSNNEIPNTSFQAVKKSSSASQENEEDTTSHSNDQTIDNNKKAELSKFLNEIRFESLTSVSDINKIEFIEEKIIKIKKELNDQLIKLQFETREKFLASYNHKSESWDCSINSKILFD